MKKIYQNNEVIMIDRTNEERRFLKRKDIDITKLKTRWEWVYSRPNLSLDFYNEVLYPRYNRVPRRDEVDQMGYRGFRNALEKIGITLNDLTKKSGYTPYYEKKYNIFSFQDLVDLFINVMIPDLINQGIVKKYQTPTLEDLNNGGYRGFIDRVYKLDRTYNELLYAVKFMPNKEFQYKGKTYQDLLEMYNSEIYPNLQMKYSLDENVPLTKEQVQEDYSGFLQKLYREGYSYIDLVKELGFQPQYEYLYRDMTYSELIFCFKNEIQPTLQDIYDFYPDAAPSYEEVEKHYRGFIAAIERHGKKFSDAIRDSGFFLRAFNDLGMATHKALNLLFSQFLNHDLIPFNYYTEVELYYPSNRLRIDGIFIINQYLLNYFISNINEITKRIPFNLKTRIMISDFIDQISQSSYLLIDYSNGYFKRGAINIELIGRKMQKYLDFHNSLLLLVGVNWEGEELIKNLPFSISYENKNISTKKVALINLTLFSEMINLDNETKSILDEIILYNRSEDITNLKYLIRKLENAHNLIFYGTKEFLDFHRKMTLDKWTKKNK